MYLNPKSLLFYRLSAISYKTEGVSVQRGENARKKMEKKAKKVATNRLVDEEKGTTKGKGMVCILYKSYKQTVISV